MIEIKLNHRFLDVSKVNNGDIISFTIPRRIYPRAYRRFQRLFLRHGKAIESNWTITQVKITRGNQVYFARAWLLLDGIKFNELREVIKCKNI